MKKTLASWLACNGEGSVHQLGHLSSGALAAVTREAAVVIVPSLCYETFGYAAAEAMLEARPVVAARIGALPELIEHERTGLLAEPGEVEEFATLTLRALDDAAAPGWGEAARAHVLGACVPGRHVEGLLAIYREAIAGD